MGRSGKEKLYDYHRGQAIIEEVKHLSQRPRMLLHSCCAPCNSAVLELLEPYFEVTIYYNNHNIYPSAEFDLRLSELQRFVSCYNQEHGTAIEIVVPAIRMDEFTAKLSVRKDEPEGGARCSMCMGIRLKETLDYAKAGHYDFVTTVMTISRCKNSRTINALAEKLMPGYPELTYFYSDFKKKQGIDRSRELCEKYDLYRQQYCGCLYSFQEYLKRKDKKSVSQ